MLRFLFKIIGFWYLLLIVNCLLGFITPYVVPFWVLTGVYWLIVGFTFMVIWIAGRKEEQLVKEEEER